MGSYNGHEQIIANACLSEIKNHAVEDYRTGYRLARESFRIIGTSNKKEGLSRVIDHVIKYNRFFLGTPDLPPLHTVNLHHSGQRLYKTGFGLILNVENHEPTSSPNHQPKKRRKDSTTRSEKGGEIVTNKHDKVGNVKMKTAARTAPLAGNKSSGSSPSLATQGEQYQDTKSKNQLVAPKEPPRKKSSEPNIKHEQSSLNINAIIGKHSENTEKQKAGAIQSRDSGMKLNVASESSDATHQIYRDKGVSVELESLSRKRLSDKEMEYSTKFRHKERNGSSELPDLNFSNTKYVAQNSANSASGMAVNDECKLKFLELKAKRNYLFIVFRTEEKIQQVMVERLGEPDESYEDFSACLPLNECRYVVFDLDLTTEENSQKSKIFFIAWSPENSRVRSKMLYASSEDRFKRVGRDSSRIAGN